MKELVSWSKLMCTLKYGPWFTNQISDMTVCVNYTFVSFTRYVSEKPQMTVFSEIIKKNLAIYSINIQKTFNQDLRSAIKTKTHVSE